MSLVQIDWNPTPKKLREFGVVMLVAFGLIGSVLVFGTWPINRSIPPLGYACWALAIISFVLGITGHKIAMIIYAPWMGVAYVLGSIISRIILILLYYGLFTPMGLLMRVARPDVLQIRKPKGSSTYWQDVPAPKSQQAHERQF